MKPQNPSLTRSFPIVGIGASAGGLPALMELLKHLPIDIGMAFVIAQYLDPKLESVLAKILSPITRMPVQTVKDGIRIKPNYVYVITSAFSIVNRDGQLSLAILEGAKNKHIMIDNFLISLALTQISKAIGVVLSGSHADGINGLSAIKAVGGTTFAQDPNSAEFDAKPARAIALGVVDMTLPPQGIAEELARISKFPDEMNLSRNSKKRKSLKT